MNMLPRLEVMLRYLVGSFSWILMSVVEYGDDIGDVWWLFSFVLQTEPPLNTPENREYTAEIMFESFNVPGLYIAVQVHQGCLLYDVVGTRYFAYVCCLMHYLHWLGVVVYFKELLVLTGCSCAGSVMDGKNGFRENAHRDRHWLGWRCHPRHSRRKCLQIWYH